MSPLLQLLVVWFFGVGGFDWFGFLFVVFGFVWWVGLLFVLGCFRLSGGGLFGGGFDCCF